MTTRRGLALRRVDERVSEIQHGPLDPVDRRNAGECICPQCVHMKALVHDVRAEALAHVREVLTPIKDHLRTARHLLKEHWSGQDNWWVGNEHTWLAQSDDEIRKAQALLDAAGT